MKRIRRDVPGFMMAVVMSVLLLACFPSVVAAEEPSQVELEVFSQGYPKSLFFRSSEYVIELDSNKEMSYEQWEEIFVRTNGIVGKVLEETQYLQDGGARHIEYFTQYKANNPEKLVIVHYNDMGKMPGPEGALDGYWAGHWLYNEGTTLTQAVSDDGNDIVLHVADASVFRDNLNYSNTTFDEVGITLLDQNGRPTWDIDEQVGITSIDYVNNTITVNRGMYGTEPLAWPAGAYLAAHPAQGSGTVLRWWYNLSTHAPVDSQGRQGMDAFIEELVSIFGPGGPLEIVDGFEFDVSRFEVCCGAYSNADFNADGVADGGYFDGVNTYGAGKMEFFQKLKAALPDKLILADAQIKDNQQRGFNILNGVESEGWPRETEWHMDTWSDGINRQLFWNQNSAAPAFSYFVHKYPEHMPEPFVQTTQRMITAASVFLDTAVTSGPFPSEYHYRYGGVYDELRKGVQEQLNWLGQPVGPPVQLAEQAADLLNGDGIHWPQSLVDQFTSSNSTLTRETSPAVHMKVTPNSQTGNYRSRSGRFTLPGIVNAGNDLFVTMTVRADPIQEYPDTIGRKLDVRALNQSTNHTYDSFTWMNEQSFDATFYFRDIGAGTIDLRFDLEGDQPVYVEKITVHSATGAMYREFENGVAFANPSEESYTFDLSQLFPGQAFRRIKGEVTPDVNNGERLGSTLTIGGKDALLVLSIDPNDTTPPSAPAGIQAGVVQDRVAVSWNAHTEPDFGWYEVEIWQADQLLKQFSTIRTEHAVEEMRAGLNYSVKVSAVDDNGNKSDETVWNGTIYDPATVIYFEGFENGLGGWYTPLTGPSTTTAAASSGSYSYVVDTDHNYIVKHLGTNLNKTVTVKFYDNVQENNMRVFARADQGGTEWRALGVHTNVSNTHYVYRAGDGTQISHIPRTTGWHEFKWDYTSGNHVDLYIDGHYIASAGGVPTFNRITLGDLWEDGQSGTVYFDDVVIFEASPPYFLEGFENGLGSWTVAKGSPATSTDQAYNGNYSFLVDQDEVSIYRFVGTQHNKALSVRFYDDADDTSMRVFARADHGGAEWRAIGVSTPHSATHYVIRIDGTITATNIPRSTGWHEFRFDYRSGDRLDLYIDGHKVASDHALTTFNRIWLGDNWADGRTAEVYFDDVRIMDPPLVYFEGFELGLDDWDVFAGTPTTSTNRAYSGSAGYVVSQAENAIERTFNAPMNAVVTMKFWDDASNLNMSVMGRVDLGAGGRSLGVNTSVSETHYLYNAVVTEVPRSTGWHELKWDYTSGNDVKMYIDGVLVRQQAAPASFNYIRIGDTWPETPASHAYFDHIAIHSPSTLIFSEGFENGTYGWIPYGATTPITTTDQAYSGNFSFAVTDDTVNAITRVFADSHSQVVTMRFYDDAADTSMQVGARVDEGGEEGRRALGVSTAGSATHYVYWIGNERFLTDVARTTGWHELKWDYTPGTHMDMYIDGQYVASAAGVTSFNQIAIGDFWDDGNIGTAYFDDIIVWP